MSRSDEAGQESGSEREGARRPRTKGTWVALLALVVLTVVISAMMAGLLDPYPKRAILKASEMSLVTGLQGHWEQTALHCFEDEGAPPFSSQQAAHSTIYFYNETTRLVITITVAEMRTSEKANGTYGEWIRTWSATGEGTTKLAIGEEGMLNGHLDPNGTPDGPVYLHFRKGVYVVEMYFDSNIATVELFEEIACDQAARL